MGTGGVRTGRAEAASPSINPNLASLRQSATLAINAKVKGARAGGGDVCHFGFGQSPFPVPPGLARALAENAHQKEYLPTKGLPELRRNVARYYEKFFGYDFDPELVIVGPGSKELIFQILYVLEGPVIVPAPSWVSYGPQLAIRGKRMEVVPTRKEDGYKLRPGVLDAFCRGMGGGQKVLVINSPNNPTGAVYGEDEVRDLARVCRRRGVIVVADEIYAQVRPGGRHAGFHSHYPEASITTAGLSKSHGAGGWRLGFAAIPRTMSEVAGCLEAMASETFSTVSCPIQHAACRSYDPDAFEDIHRHVRQCARVHAACASYVHGRLLAMGLDCPAPEGAFYIFPDFGAFRGALAAEGISTDGELAHRLFDRHGVAVLPGSDFYHPAEALAVRLAAVDYDGRRVLEASLGERELGGAFVEGACPNLARGCDRIQGFLESLSRKRPSRVPRNSSVPR